MHEAEKCFPEAGWAVLNVSARSCYDLHCSRPSGEELHVEVKGTQSVGARVLLTRNEVAHARACFPRTALYVLSQVQVNDSGGGNLEVSGGVPIVAEPWEIREEGLTPLTFEYSV